MAFFADDAGKHYVALRWYAEECKTPAHTVLELSPFNLTPEDKPKSYSILPEECIMNGAVLIKWRSTYWAVQSPREEFAYARNNLKFQPSHVPFATA
jgi:hypothetical protein